MGLFQGQLHLNKRKIGFSVMQFGYWTAIASFSTFVVALARAKGMSATVIGIMVACFQISAVIGQMFWGAICDKFKSHRNVLLITCSLMVCISVFHYFSSATYFIILTYIILGFVQAPTMSNLDAWILKEVQNDSRQYGPIRSFGSLGYGIFILFYGNLLAKYGYWMMPIFLVFFMGITITAVALLREEKGCCTDPSRKKPEMSMGDVKALFLNRYYITMLVILFLTGLSTMSIGQMKILIWEDMGASIAFHGYDGFVGAITQFPVFLMTARFGKIPALKRLMLGVALYLAMLSLVFFAKAPQLVILGSSLSGIAYAMMTPAVRELIATTTPETLRTTAQGMGDAAQFSLSGIMGGLFSGTMVDAIGVKAMVLTCLLIHMIPVALTATVVRKKLREGSGTEKAEVPETQALLSSEPLFVLQEAAGAETEQYGNVQ